MNEYSITEIHRLMEQESLTAETLVREYLERINDIDRNGPSLNAVIEINPDAVQIARDLDRRLASEGMAGPLHGIPILVKDNIDTADRMATTAGSLAIEMYGGRATRDAHVITRLREAGAIILGKTNLSEMANFRGRRSTSGWSSRGGLTKNPYALNRNPSGSSSGSGAAVAANLCAVALGTETDGSVIAPATSNGIVGIKPSIGLVSRAGIIPIAATQDTAGPMARSVRDAAILLDVMVGHDPADEATSPAADLVRDYAGGLERATLRGARIGVLHKSFRTHFSADRVWQAARDLLVAEGAELVDVEMTLPENWGNPASGEAQEFTVMLHEYKRGLNDYFAGRSDSRIATIEDLIRFNEELSERSMPYFGQEHLVAAAAKGDLTDENYQAALRDYEIFRENLSGLFASNGLDALLAPSGGPAGVTDLVNGDSSGGLGNSQLAAVSGYCSITVPAGYAQGLPVGLSFIGERFQEQKIIDLAYAFEQANPVRVPPAFVAWI